MAENNGDNSFQRLIEVGIALSAERNPDRLMERILIEAKEICNADGGTLYIKTEDNTLKFEIMRTDSLGIAKGGTSGEEVSLPPVRLFDPETNEENRKNIASFAALSGESINIPDAYDSTQFDFTGTKMFDEATGYRSTSFLTVPLKNSQGEIIGVLQLLNAQDTNGEVIEFSAQVQPLIEALASQAAVALDNQQLLAGQKLLLDSFIELIASAIDAKSPYTGGHCQRVPELSMMLADAAVEETEGPFAEYNLTEDERYELKTAALLHDCGKVTTPEYIVDKATKLETIYDRVHEVRTRFEVIKRDSVIEYLKAVIEAKEEPEALREALEKKLAKIDDDYAFIAECNVGGEFMAPEKIDRLNEIAEITWTRTLDDRIGISFEESKRKEREPAPELPVVENLLSNRPDHIIYHDAPIAAAEENNPYGFKLSVPEHKFNLGEVSNLSIGRGTLTDEDRFKINDHIVQTIIMLDQLPFPKHLKKVPEYAGGHHEKMDGTGYPKQLTEDQMSLPAKIMAVADIFEALTAADRPYKPAKTLSASIKIMSFMVKDQHIDGDLFKLFLKSGAYKVYADKFLLPEQVDEVDITPYL